VSKLMTGWPTVVIVCTDRGKHKPRRLGEVGEAGIVTTIGGGKDRRQASPRGDGRNIHPEPCPVCHRTPRLSRERWQQEFACAAAAGVSRVDISHIL
jgi:hypothetical protein